MEQGRAVPVSMTGLPSSDASLLAEMAMQGREPNRARAAWGELFERHRQYLFAVVWRTYGSFLGEDGSADLTSDTFQRAFDWAGRQPSPEGVEAEFTGNSPESTRRRVLGWLGKIAIQLFKDRYRAEATKASRFNEYLDQWRAGNEHPAPPIDSELMTALSGALGSLTTPEADALRVSLPWYAPESRSFAFARGEAERVAQALGISTESLRQNRHRAIKRIEAHLEKAGVRTEGGQ